jgi:hypothetical protein
MSAVEHPDTIALRECRAEKDELLNGVTKYWVEQHDAAVMDRNDQLDRAVKAELALESARAERDTALAAHGLEVTQHCQCRIDLRTALARIAKLDAEVDALNQRLGGLL